MGTIKRTLPDWRADLVHAHEQLSMSIIRLYPNYHSYKLDDACFADLLDFAVKRQLAVQVGRDRGRIYRLEPPNLRVTAPPRLGNATSNELVKTLDDPRAWWRETKARAFRLHFWRSPNRSAGHVNIAFQVVASISSSAQSTRKRNVVECQLLAKRISY